MDLRYSWAVATLTMVIFTGTATAWRGADSFQPTDSIPLRLTLSCEQEPTTVTFRLTLQNVIKAPAAVVIGAILGNGLRYLPGPIVFTLRRAGAADATIQFVDSSAAVVGGRVDPWLVPLPEGASYSMPLLIEPQIRQWFSAPAEVQAQLTTRDIGAPTIDLQAEQGVHVWVGRLTSQWIRFPDTCVGLVVG